MAQIAVKPRVFKDYVLTIAADSYEKHVSGVSITPQSSVVTWQGGTPDATFTDATSPTWTCGIDYAQDWETPNSFSQYLLANAGETVAATFKPLGAAGPTFNVDLVITPGAIGGAIGGYGTASVQLGVAGAPEFVPAA